jgi:hypothetical protein
MQSWPVAEKVTRGWQSGKHFYPDDLVAEVQTVYVRDAEVAELREFARVTEDRRAELFQKLAAAEATIEMVRTTLLSQNRLDRYSDVPLRWCIRQAHEVLTAYRGKKP